jgi:hypothetical protein
MCVYLCVCVFEREREREREKEICVSLNVILNVDSRTIVGYK